MFDENMHTGRLFADARRAGRQDADQGDALHVLSWQELRARLAAAHDLRRIMECQRHAHQASFAAGAAIHLREYGHGIRDVNPDGLGNCKGNGRIRDPEEQAPSSVTRGQDD